MMRAVLIRNASAAESDSEGEEVTDDSIRPSFITAANEDVFSTTTNHSVVPDVRRNILSEINNMEATVLQPSHSHEKEFLQVYLRVKPKTEEEAQIAKDGGFESCDMVTIESEHDISLTAPLESKAFKTSGFTGKITNHFTFSKILKPETDQKQIFTDIVMPRIKEFLEGRNQLLFTYGATGAGKTFTIQGTLEEPGVMPNSFQTLFKTLEGKLNSDIPLIPVGYNSTAPADANDLATKAKERDEVFKLGQELEKVRGVSPTPSVSSNTSHLSQASQASSKNTTLESLDTSNNHSVFLSNESSKLSINDENISYSVWISFAEIYNEQIHDLFQRVQVPKKKGEKVKRPTLKLAQDRNGFTYIKDLTEFQVDSAEDAVKALSIGRKNLQFAATKLNQESSRSHCIFTVKIVRVADAKNPHLARVSLFSFCDLAGSERISKTENTGLRLKEAGNINTSLLVLGRCIKTIRANQESKTLKKKQQNLPPFRESKLTRLIKDYLVGHGKASLLVCVSQAPYLFDESLHVLKFAAIASKVSVEEFKAPEPVAPEPPPKRSRFSSMMAGGMGVDRSIMSMGGRDSTIQWAPSSRSTMLPHLSRGKSSLFAPPVRSTMCPLPALPRMSIAEADETMDETTMAETTMIPAENYNNLINVMEEMVEKLKAEKKRNRELEGELKNQEKNLRSELCTEFNRLLVETEELYKDQLEKVTEREREYGQWRVDALMEEMEKRKKRKRSVSGGGGESQEQQLVTLEDKLSKETAEVAALKEQLDEAASVEKALKETVTAAVSQRENMQTKNSELLQQLAEQHRATEELKKELHVARERLDSEQKLNAQKFECEETEISNLKLQVSTLRSDIAKKEEENADMKELLQEAGDEFLAKQEEVDQLTTSVKELENKLAQQGLVLGDVEVQLEESHVLLRELNDQMEDKEARVDELEEKIEELKQMNKIKEERCVTAEKFIDELKKELDETKQELSKSGNDDSYKKIQALQEEKDELLSAKNALLAELADIKSGQARSEEIQLKVQCNELKNDLLENEKLTQGLQQEISQLQEKNSTLKQELSDYKLEVEALKNLTNNKDEKLDESLIIDKDDFALVRAEKEQLAAAKTKLENDLAEATKKVETVEQELIKAQNELADALKEAEITKKEMDKVKEDKQMDKRFESVLETGEFEVTEELIQKEEQVENLKTQLEKVVKEKEILETECKDLQSHAEELQKERDDLNLQLNDLRTTNDRISTELENINQEFNNAKEQLKEKDNVETQLSDQTELKQQLETEKSAKADLEKQLESEKADFEDKLNAEQSARKELESQLTAEKSSKAELEEKLSQERSSKTNIENLLATEKSKLTEIETKLDQFRTDKDNLETEIKNLKEASKKLQAEFDEKEKAKEEKIKSLEAELDSAKTAHDEVVKTMEKEIEVLRSKPEEAHQKLKKIQEEHESEIKKFSSLKKELEDRICVLTDKLNEADNKTDENNKIIELEGRVGGLEKDVATKEAYIKELEDIMVEKEFKITELETEATKLKESSNSKIEEGKADLESEIAKFEEKCASIEADLKLSAEKVRSLERSLEENTELYKKDSKEHQKIVSKMEKENSSLGERISELEKKLSASKEEIATLQEKLAQSDLEESNKKKISDDKKDLTLKLNELEQENCDLKAEVSQLIRIQEEKAAAHEKELKRIKRASEMVISEYRDTNAKLSKMTGKSLSPGAESAVSITITESSQLEDADDDSSLLACTPVVRTKSGARRGRGRTAASGATASSNKSRAATRLSSGQSHGASFEDSENENEPSKKKLTRKPRVVKSKNVSYQEAYPPAEAESAKKRVLRERQLGTSFNQSVEKDEDSASDFALPSLSTKKKRRLYSTTPQVSAVFTPPTDTEGHGESPGSMVKRQLRTRRKKK